MLVLSIIHKLTEAEVKCLVTRIRKWSLDVGYMSSQSSVPENSAEVMISEKANV